MCLIITAVVPDEVRNQAFAEVTKKHQLSFAPCENWHLQGQLRPSEQYVQATATHCDCGSPLFAKPKDRTQENLVRQLAKLRRKGWSEAKIRKWSESTAPRPVDPNAAPKGQRSVHDWAEFLEEALSLGNAPYVGLVGHWYSGDVSTEQFTLSGRVQHFVDVLRVGRFGGLEEDMVHEFRLNLKDAA
jgi:hypothetical protein